MNEINTGGPAFPTPRYERGDMYSLGLSIRDYFAAKAMQGMLADSAAINEATGERLAVPDDEELIASAAYSMADAMLKAREGGQA